MIQVDRLRNLFGWPVVDGALRCPECDAPATESAWPGAHGQPTAYHAACTKCWKAQTIDPTSKRKD